MLSYGSSYGVPTAIVPSARSTHAPTQDKTIIGGQNGSSDNAIAPGNTSSRKNTCKMCNVTFKSPQAYGGHMSSHSKARKKGLQG